MKRLLVLMVAGMALVNLMGCSAYQMMKTTVDGKTIEGPIPNILVDSTKDYVQYLVDHINARKKMDKDEMRPLIIKMNASMKKFEKSSDVDAISKKVVDGEFTSDQLYPMMEVIKELGSIEYYPDKSADENELYTAYIIERNQVLFDYIEQILKMKVVPIDWSKIKLVRYDISYFYRDTHGEVSYQIFDSSHRDEMKAISIFLEMQSLIYHSDSYNFDGIGGKIAEWETYGSSSFMSSDNNPYDIYGLKKFRQNNNIKEALSKDMSFYFMIVIKTVDEAKNVMMYALLQAVPELKDATVNVDLVKKKLAQFCDESKKSMSFPDPLFRTFKFTKSDSPFQLN